jgi:adenosylcobyric acid synthase
LPDRRLRIGVIAIPHMANFTDFDALAAEPSVSIAFFEDPAEADVIVLPGSKQTLDDLLWIRERGFAELLERHEGIVIGICGGFQMLGLTIEDPAGVESAGRGRSVIGLKKLPVRTTMLGEKTVRRVRGRVELWNSPSFSGYEIHMGETSYENDAEPFAWIRREGDEATDVIDGAVLDSGRVFGTYVHGLFDDDVFRHSFLNFARKRCGLVPARNYAKVTAEREARLDRWAGHLRESLDMRMIREWAGV